MENSNFLLSVLGQTLYLDSDATLDDLREAVETLEETTRIARRTFGGAHPLTEQIELALQAAREMLLSIQ